MSLESLEAWTWLVVWQDEMRRDYRRSGEVRAHTAQEAWMKAVNRAEGSERVFHVERLHHGPRTDHNSG